MFSAPRRLQLLFLLTFLLSAGLRLGLVRYNRESNDDHVEVIQLILRTNRLPVKDDCNECFQPKLFHYAMTNLLQLSGLANAKQDTIILAVELVNYAAGLITLLIIGFFLYRLPGQNALLKVLAFGLVALNPQLIGINSQATNDTWAILFSTLALFCTYAFLQNQRPITFLLVLAFLVLGISSKTNNWVTAIAILLALVVKAWTAGQGGSRTALTALLLGSATLILSILNPLNQYLTNYRDYGSPILLNIKPQPLPQVFEQIPVPVLDGPGILSIQDGFFTFKYIALLQHPRNEGGSVYPAHRTSLWTQLYGYAHSIHFGNWPAAWSTTGEQGFALSRAIYVLALLPTALLLIGLVSETILVVKAFIQRDADIASGTQFGLTAATSWGFMLFISLYSLEYRDFPVMKAIFIYPALITFPLLFLRAGEAFFSYATKRLRWARLALGIWITALFILYIADVVTMITLIYSRRYGL